MGLEEAIVRNQNEKVVVEKDRMRREAGIGGEHGFILGWKKEEKKV